MTSPDYPPSNSADRTYAGVEKPITKQDFQMGREASNLLMSGDLQPKRAIQQDDVTHLAFGDDIYPRKNVDVVRPDPQQEAAQRAEPVKPKMLDADSERPGSERPDRDRPGSETREAQQNEAVQRASKQRAPKEQDTQEVLDNVMKHLLDSTGNPAEFDRTIQKVFDYLSNLLGFDSKSGGASGGGSGGGFSSMGGSDRGGHGRNENGTNGRDENGSSEHRKSSFDGPGNENGRSEIESIEHRRNEKRNEVARNSDEGIAYIQPKDIPHQLWRTFRQNGFPALNQDIGTAQPREVAPPVNIRQPAEPFSNDPELDSFRATLNDYDRQNFDAQLNQLVGKFERNTSSQELENGNTVLNSLFQRLDASPVIDSADNSRIKFLEKSIVTGDVQNIMMLMNAENPSDLKLAMSVLDKELRPLGIKVDYGIENGVGNMIIRSNKEDGYIKVNANDAAMYDKRGYMLDSTFSSEEQDLPSDSTSGTAAGRGGADQNNFAPPSRDDSYHAYYMQYRDDIRAGMPVPNYDDYRKQVNGYNDDYDDYKRY